MMRLIIGSSLRFRYLVLALGVVLTWFGLARLRDVPVDVFPEFAPPRVEIQTICLGLSSAEVEQLVSVPLENALNGVPDIEVMRSKSVAQLSSILLIFKSGADEIRARQLVSERMALASKALPTWAAPPFMMPPLSSTSRIMKIGITSKDKSVMDLSMLSYWTIRQRLLGVSGVANIAIWGEQLKMLQVMVDPKRLAEVDVTLDQVQEAVSDALDVGLLRYARGAHIGTGGFVETPNERFQLRFVGGGVTPETLAKVPVTHPDGKPPLLLSDVANLVYARRVLLGFNRFRIAQLFALSPPTDFDVAHTGCVVLELLGVRAFTLAALHDHQNILVAAGRDTDLLTCFFYRCAIGPVERRRRIALRVAGCSRPRVCLHHDSRNSSHPCRRSRRYRP